MADRTKRASFHTICWLISCSMLASAMPSNCAQAAIELGGALDDDRWSLVYYPFDGSLSFDPGGRPATTMEISSEAGYFVGEQPDIVLPPFDVFQPHKFFLLKTDGFGPADFGPVLKPGLGALELANDLTVNGSCLPDCNTRTDLIYVPEPKGSTLLAGSIVLLLIRSRVLATSASARRATGTHGRSLGLAVSEERAKRSSPRCASVDHRQVT